MMHGKKILVVDDEAELRTSVKKMLQKEGVQVFTASSGPEALALMAQSPFDAILCDLVMPHMDGIEFLRKAKKQQPEVDLIMLTAHGTIESAVEAMREKAYDFITKPFKRVTLLKAIEKVLEKQSLERENRFLRSQLEANERHRILIGNSPGLRQVQNWIERVAPINSTILITGESGTGKELVAREIHRKSPRSAKRFVAINCGAIPENLIESELFGHVRGAFTGAIRDKDGLFRTAHDGTLFLDEIGSIPSTLQIKLLRALEEKEIMPVGAVTPVQVNVRIIAASNKELPAEVAAGRIREDLFYRLNVVGIMVPPLRERKEDIPLLANFFIEKHNRKLGKAIKKINSETMQMLIDYEWKGNARELDNVIERATILCDEQEIKPEHLPVNLREKNSPILPIANLKDAIRRCEREYILQILRQTNNDKSATAQLLGVSQSSLYRKMTELGIPTLLLQS